MLHAFLNLLSELRVFCSLLLPLICDILALCRGQNGKLTKSKVPKLLNCLGAHEKVDRYYIHCLLVNIRLSGTGVSRVLWKWN